MIKNHSVGHGSYSWTTDSHGRTTSRTTNNSGFTRTTYYENGRRTGEKITYKSTGQTKYR